MQAKSHSSTCSLHSQNDHICLFEVCCNVENKERTQLNFENNSFPFFIISHFLVHNPKTSCMLPCPNQGLFLTLLPSEPPKIHSFGRFECNRVNMEFLAILRAIGLIWSFDHSECNRVYMEFWPF